MHLTRLETSLPEYPGARQLFALVGRTLFWNHVTPRIHESELVKWSIKLKEMEKYYQIAEQVMNVVRAFAKGSTLSNIFLNRLWEGHFPEASYTPLAVDLEPTQFGKVRSNVFFSAIIFLAKAMRRHSFDLAVNARVVEVYTENGKAVGVKVMTPDKKSYLLKAKTIVLSASSFETPRLLLHSGSKDAQSAII